MAMAAAPPPGKLVHQHTSRRHFTLGAGPDEDGEWPPTILKKGYQDGEDGTAFEDYRFKFESAPPPPAQLWDVEDATRLDLARCRAFVRVVELDPKFGTFRLRMKCLWAFRTLNSKEEAEIHLRGVPGVRMPGLMVTVEESRIWKDLAYDDASPGSATTERTLCWRGVTLLTVDGFKAFDMHDVPYDRHILNLERLEFVWRTHKDEADHHKSMKVVSLEVHTSSILPEWKALRAYIRPLNETMADVDATPGDSQVPTYASRFAVHLRIQRKHKFYVWQVFLVTYLITLLSCMPLAMPADERYLAQRLVLYSGGMLTLVAFKYGVSDHLPCVPYQTFTDWFLLAAVLTIFMCAICTLYPFRLTGDDDHKEMILEWAEQSLALCVAGGWTVYLLWACFVKPGRRVLWRDILMMDQDGQDPFAREENADRDSLNRRPKKVKQMARDLRHALSSYDPFFFLNEGNDSLSSPLASSMNLRAREAPQLTGTAAEQWTLREVAEFISSLGLGHCLHQFKENAVDGRMLVQLSKEEMEKELGLKPLQAKKVLTHLKPLRGRPAATKVG